MKAAPILLDTTIRVIRSVPVPYPDWASEPLPLDLDKIGPAEYDITGPQIQLWLHDGQKGGSGGSRHGHRVDGYCIFRFLNATNGLKSCLGLHDAIEIQRRGIVFFRKIFKKKVPFFWKSTVQNHQRNLVAPCLFDNGSEVVIEWRWLERDWGGGYPALRFVTP
jgi:hypothetical protein